MQKSTKPSRQRIPELPCVKIHNIFVDYEIPNVLILSIESDFNYDQSFQR
jgi:hypothetical protein